MAMINDAGKISYSKTEMKLIIEAMQEVVSNDPSVTHYAISVEVMRRGVKMYIHPERLDSQAENKAFIVKPCVTFFP